MSKINERCAGIDVGKRFLLCCVLTAAANEEPTPRTVRFDTTVAALTRLREMACWPWLRNSTTTTPSPVQRRAHHHLEICC